MNSVDLKILIDDLVFNQNFLSYYELKSYLQKYDETITGDDMGEYYRYYKNAVLKYHDKIIKRLRENIKEGKYSKGKSKSQLKQLKDFKNSLS